MPDNRSVLSVAELTRRIKGVLEGEFTDVAVQGEISNFKRHTSGHLYFTLKDESSQIQVVMWRNRAAALFFTPQDGMKVVVRGRIAVYEVRGIYQIDAAALQPLGTGELQLAFERLKQKLNAEGLFDPSHKKAIPHFPARIGIVTSPTGAALHDIINIIGRRFPAVELILNPVKVQGTGAASEIADAIRDFNEYGKIDVMIVGRGGGSLEDLWAFNEEEVARAIYASKLPVISAVGHEIDYTIADFVADLRAPTPSAAAEMVVPDMSDVVELLRNFCYTAGRIAATRVTTERERIAAMLRSRGFHRPADLIRQYMQRTDELYRSLSQLAGHTAVLARERLTSLGKRLSAANPAAILNRGYAMIYRNGTILGEAASLRKADVVRIRFHDGSAPATIQEAPSIGRGGKDI